MCLISIQHKNWIWHFFSQPHTLGKDCTSSAQQNEHLPFLISGAEANDEPLVCWQKEWNWIVYKRPSETKHMFQKMCWMKWSFVQCIRESVGVQVLKYRWRSKKKGGGLRSVCVISVGTATIVFFSFQSLLITHKGITHQRSLSSYPILLWPLPAFVHIQHNNSGPQAAASRLLPAPPIALPLGRD